MDLSARWLIDAGPFAPLPWSSSGCRTCVTVTRQSSVMVRFIMPSDVSIISRLARVARGAFHVPQTINACQDNDLHLRRRGPSSNPPSESTTSYICFTPSENEGSTQPVLSELSSYTCSCPVANARPRRVPCWDLGSAAQLTRTKPGVSYCSYKPRDSGSPPPPIPWLVKYFL